MQNRDVLTLYRQHTRDCRHRTRGRRWTHLREYRQSLSRYAVTTQRARLEQVRAFFRFCQKSGWIQTNPASDLELPIPDREEIQTFEAEEIDRLLAVARSFTAKGRYGDGNRKRITAMGLGRASVSTTATLTQEFSL